MKIIGRASAVNLELDAGGIVNVFTTAAIAVPFDQTNVEVVDNDGHHKYLIELAEVTSYTPEGGVETVFSGTRDQLIDILNEQFFTGGTGGGGFTPTTDVLQSQIVNFNIDTVANAKALTYTLNDRVYIDELDEVFQAKNILVSALGNIAGGMHKIGNRIYAITSNGGSSTDGAIVSFYPPLGDDGIIMEYSFNLARDGVATPMGQIAFTNNNLYIVFLDGGANNLGAIGKFDTISKEFTKIIDLSTATGYDVPAGGQPSVVTGREFSDPYLFNNKIYESFNRGGANSFGTILEIDLSTETANVIHSYTNYDGGDVPNSSAGFGVHSNELHITRNREWFILDTLGNLTIIPNNIPVGVSANFSLRGEIVEVGTDYYVANFSTSASFNHVVKYDSLSGNFTSIHVPAQGSEPSLIRALTLLQYNSNLYVINIVTGEHPAVSAFDPVAKTITSIHREVDNTATTDIGFAFLLDGPLVYLPDNTRDIKTINLSNNQVTTVLNINNATKVADDTSVIDIGEDPMYLQVRDNHIKSISTNNGLATITTARGVESTFNYSSGFIDYNDSSAAVTLVANTWTDVPNDGAGAFSNDTYRPNGVNDILNTTTGYLDFSELGLGDEVFLRIDFNVTPNLNNAFLECRMELGAGASTYQLDVFSKRLDNGAGISYPSEKGAFYVYMGDGNTLNNPGKLQVRLSSGGSLDNAGVAISIIKK